ncbi:MAG: S9 family peptidase [Myxococcota bacterium]
MAFTVEDLVGMRRVEAVAAAPDGTWHAVEVHTVDEETGRYHPAIWRIDADGTATELLRGNCAYRQPGFRSDGKLAVVTNRPLDALEGEPEERPDDDVRNQVWLLDGEALRPLTDEPLGVQRFAFAREGNGLFVIAAVLPGVAHDQQRETADDRRKKGPSMLRYTAMPVRQWDHWESVAAPHLIAYDNEGEGRRDLTPEADREHRQASWDVSPDGRQVVIGASRKNQYGIDDVRLQLIDVATGASRFVFDVPDELATMARFSPDGGRLVFSQQRWEAGVCVRERLYVVNADGTGARDVTPDWERWAHPVGWLGDDRVVVSADDDAEHRLFTVEVSTGTVTPWSLPEGRGHIGAVSIAGDGVVGIAHGLQHAPEVFRMEASGEATQLTSLVDAIDFAELGAVERATVSGAGGDPVQYWLLVPRGVEGPRPTVFWIHGGPIGAWNDQWHWRWNANVLLDQGYAVVLPNPRGSTGFGQAFIDGIWNNAWGEACFDDVMAVVDAVAGDARVDARRMVAMGGSFGGYMTNFLGGKTDRFAGLVTHASLWDLPMFASTTDHPSFWRHQSGVDRWRDLEGVERYSPHANVANWRTPTLILHGEKDYRVPISEALALFDALQHHGVESELVVFPDENHWILRPRNIVAWYGACLDFIGRRTS